MNTNENTSSADNADLQSQADELNYWLTELAVPFSGLTLQQRVKEMGERLLAAYKESAAIVPQVVQAPIEAWLIESYDCNDKLKKRVVLAPLTDDVHLDESSEAIALCRVEKAAPIVASVPSEPVLYQRRMRPAWRDAVTGWSGWEDCSKESVEEILRLPTFSEDWQYETRTLYATPISPAAEQASDVRNAAIDECAKIPREYAMQLDKSGFGNRFPDDLTAIFNASTNMADKMRALKSTPAAKGNAPAEAKS